jgi:nitrite reductase/ring-hydroxylating ferredoxin subunit
MKVRVCLFEEVPLGEMNDFKVDGRTILMVNVDGDILAMDGLCSHRKGVLAKGTREGYVVKCPRHGTEYDLRNGKVVRNVRIPLIGKATDLRTYPVIVEREEIFIEI